MNNLVARLRAQPTERTYDSVGRAYDFPKHLIEEAASRISQQDAELERVRRELEEAKAVIAWANNSLFGSHGFFLSLDGGDPDEHHLDRAIEDLKERNRKLHNELAEARRHIELLQEKDASQCGCSIDRPDDVCLFHVRMKAEARKAALIEAAEMAGKLLMAEFTPQEPGFMRGIGYAAQTIFDDLRAKAEETDRG